MNVYQVRYHLGGKYRIAADWLVDKAEAEAIRDGMHPGAEVVVVAAYDEQGLQLQEVEQVDQKARDMLAYQNAMFAAACLAKMPLCRGGECGQ
jgi:hypothetical protein